MALTLQPQCKQSKVPVRDAPQGAGTGSADSSSFSRKCIVREIEQDGQLISAVYEKTLVHTFRMADVEDPEIYAAGPMWDWQKSDQGTWCFDHALPNSLEYRIDTDIASYGYRVAIIGHFRKEDLVYFYLKWPQTC